MAIKNCFYLPYFFGGAVFSGDCSKAFIEFAKKKKKKTQVWVGFTLSASLQTLLWCDSLSVARKDILGTSEYSVQEQRVRGFILHHESFLPHRFPSFVLAEGDASSPLGFEDL